MIRFELQGMEKIRERFKGLTKRGLDAMEAALIAEAGEVMNTGQTLVPVVTGRLRSSAYVRKVSRNQHRSDLRFGYAAPYAVFVHERPGRGYKWLRRALAMTANARKRRLQRAFNDAMRRR